MKKTRLILIIIAVSAFIVLGCLVIWWGINLSGVREITDENKDLIIGVFATEEPLKDDLRYFGEEKELYGTEFDTGVAGYSCIAEKS